METEIRPIHELLIILRDNARVKTTMFGLRRRIRLGLCFEVIRMSGSNIITTDERIRLLSYFDYLPNNKRYFSYSWKPTLWKPRLKWLNEHIELTKLKQ